MPRIAVVGTGLIGGSIGLAAKARLGATVVGVDGESAGRALELGAIDEATTLPGAVAEADAVFVAVPVDLLVEEVGRVLEHAPPGCVVTDAGSVKRALVSSVDDERFVGGHPLAGGEGAGVEHARADLFEGATWYLTPTPHTAGLRLEELHRLIGGLGARPTILDPATHDRVMAAVSHLPHVLANVLVGRAAQALGGETLPAIGPSLRDATRVAGANPALWEGIYAANREALVEQLDEAAATLAEVRGWLAAGEHDRVRAWQEEAAREHEGLRDAAAGEEQAELRAIVPNRPGVVADVALTLAGEGINISDMSLAPSPDMATGALALWVPATRADRARALLADLGLSA